MKQRILRCTLLAAVAAVCLAQMPDVTAPTGERHTEAKEGEVKLPSGKLQRDEILKAEYAVNRKEAAQLLELAQQLRNDLEKNGQYVFSLSDVKKAEEIEKLAHKIRGRMQSH